MSELINKQYLEKQFSGYSEVIKEQLNKKVDKTELENYYTSDKVDEIIENLSTGDVDLDGYAKTEDVNNALDLKADKTELFSGSYNDLTDKPTIPSTDGLATTDYVDNAVSNVTVDTSNLVTDEELTTTLADYAKSADITEYDDTEVKESIANLTDTKADKTELDAYVTDTELTDKGYATETWVNEQGFLTQHQDLSNYATKDELPSLDGYATESYVTEQISNIPSVDLTDYAKKNEIPDVSGYITEEQLLAKDYADKAYVTEEIAKASTGGEIDLSAYLSKVEATETYVTKESGKSLIADTEIERLASVDNYDDTEIDNRIRAIEDDYIKNTDLAAVAKSGSYNDLIDTPSIPSIEGLAKTEDIPTKVSELENDSNYLSSIPEEYVTETELNAKGYLTSHQDISGLQTKTDDKLATTSKEVVGAINELKKGVSSISVPTKVSQLTNDSGYLSSEDITSTINSTSTDTQIPTAKAVNVAIKGKLITQEDIDTYGKEIIKFPVGKWTIGSVAISNLTDLPNSYVRYIEIIGISEVTNPWTNNNTLRSYKATSYKGDTFLRSLNSGSEAGVIASDTGWQRVLLNGDIIDNLTSTDTNKLLSANQGKILNDTKLNKTDANKLNCVTIDNVSLKEYILTNFTETGKTYYLVAKTTCTDLPKASNFYITVETPGMYTYKVTAKELNDSNGRYVCTYRTISSSWTAWEKVCTTTVADVPETTVDLTGTDIHGSIKYMVKSGICYVSAWGVLSDTAKAAHILVKADVMPKPIISCGTVLVHGNAELNGKLVGHLYIDYNKALSLHIYPDSVGQTGFGSFSYPVAES